MRKTIQITGIMVTVILLIYIWGQFAEETTHWSPDYNKLDITEMLDKESLSEEEYQKLFYQTGLGKQAVKYYIENHDTIIIDIQKAFFEKNMFICKANSPISKEEKLIDSDSLYFSPVIFAPLEEGDILITPNSHTFGWRNGHAAIVVDTKLGKTLESVVIGQNSCVQNIDKWRYYPSFIILRLKDANQETRKEIAQYAYETLTDIPYGFATGLVAPKYEKEQITQTHCAHLIWAAYRKYGYDIDSTGGAIITPRDIANSPLLEVIQIYGMDPSKLWKK